MTLITLTVTEQDLTDRNYKTLKSSIVWRKCKTNGRSMIVAIAYEKKPPFDRKGKYSVNIYSAGISADVDSKEEAIKFVEKYLLMEAL